MSVIRRSMMRHHESGNWGMPETPDGNYVNYSAYEALLAEAIKLRAAVLQHSVSTHQCLVCGEADDCISDDVCYVLDETPIVKEAMDV